MFVVATPIGNLGDLSPRALETLKTVAAICAEDTRHTRQLLAHFGTVSGATYEEGDIDGDGAVDIADLGLLLANFGA